MKSSKTYGSTGIKSVDMVLIDVYKNINALYDAVNPSQASVGYGASGKSGDIRFIEGEDKLAYLEMKGDKGWYTSFAGVMVEKPAIGRPYPHFPYLEVDNLYAKIFTVNQTTSSNGNMIMSDYGIVDSLTNNTITFKDQTNLNLCGFQVGDTCEVRSIKADKSLNIKKINFTVTAVSGRTVTVTYSGTDRVAVGDIVVRIGNTTTAARQNAIYFSTSDTNSPYIDFYSGTTGYTFGAPIVRVGKLSGITDTDFGGALSGNGLYATNVYLKGAIRLNNPTTFNNGGKLNTSNLNNDSGWTGLETYGSGSSFPGTPATGDWYFWTGAEGTYHTNSWYRYNGSAWVQFGLLGTYIDGTGIYTGTVVANHIIAGTGIINALSVLNTLTMGSASTDGIIQSYGWNGTANGFQIKGGATPTINLIGGTITGGTIQTSVSTYPLIRLDGTGNYLRFYGSAGSYSELSSQTYSFGASSYTDLMLNGNLVLNTVGYIKAFNQETLSYPNDHKARAMYLDLTDMYLYTNFADQGGYSEYNTAGFVTIANGATKYLPKLRFQYSTTSPSQTDNIYMYGTRTSFGSPYLSLDGTLGIGSFSSTDLTGYSLVTAGNVLSEGSITFNSDIKTTQGNLSVATGTIDVTGKTFIKLETTGGNRTITTINGGADGKIIYLYSNDATYTITFDETGNLLLAGTSFVMSNSGTLTLIYSATKSKWLELARSNN